MATTASAVHIQDAEAKDSHSQSKQSSTSEATQSISTSSSSRNNVKSQKLKDKNKKNKKRKPKRQRSTEEKESTKKDSFGASLGRAMIGTLAFVFKRPVRLFRPVKLSSWTLLEAMAKRENRTLGIRYLRTLLKREKSSFLPHLLLPPLIMNATIGFVLFEGYSQTEAFLLRRYYPSIPVPPGPFDSQSETERQQQQQRQQSESGISKGDGRTKPNFSPLWIVTISGFVAGAAQCIISAPLDNVRIVLQSSTPSSKTRSRGNHHHSSTSSPSPTLNFSWRAIARAAILPFAPSVSRERLVSKIKDSQQSDPKTSIWKSILSWNRNGKQDKVMEKKIQLTNQERRILWEKKLKRWRGGIHGAGLVFSLMRDSFGFASFFVIFEISRRCAYHASLTIDRIQAFASARAALPSSIPIPTSSSRSTSRSRSSDEFHTESSSDMEISDVSFSTSRTISGRVIAALCLIVGGACGAAIYELVGRPFELAREVVWQGRKNWEEGKRKSKDYDKYAWTGGRGRSSSSSANKRHGSGFVGARVKYRRSMTKSKGIRNGLIELRSGNSLGNRNSRIESGFRMGLDRPPHPLRLGKMRNKERKIEVLERLRQERNHQRLGPNRKRNQNQSEAPSSKPSSRKVSNPEIKAEIEEERIQPSLSTRPSALTLLIEHAQRTSSLRFVSSHSTTPTPVPIPILLFHTYFLSPFSRNSNQIPSTSPKVSINSKKLDSSSPEAKVRSRWTFNNPVSSPPRAKNWGQGRTMWALKRLSTPYGLGFVLFAYLSGDLT